MQVRKDVYSGGWTWWVNKDGITLYSSRKESGFDKSTNV
jgi:hypothetical protein